MFVQLKMSGHRNKRTYIIAKLNGDMQAIHNWSIRNGLQLNAAKSA